MNLLITLVMLLPLSTSISDVSAAALGHWTHTAVRLELLTSLDQIYGKYADVEAVLFQDREFVVQVRQLPYLFLLEPGRPESRDQMAAEYIAWWVKDQDCWDGIRICWQDGKDRLRECIFRRDDYILQGEQYRFNTCRIQIPSADQGSRFLSLPEMDSLSDGIFT